MVSRRLRMGQRSQLSPLREGISRQLEKNLSEEEAELVEYERSGGDFGKPYEKAVVFGMLGVSSLLMNLLLGWIIFKKFWFGWLGMPGWW